MDATPALFLVLFLFLLIGVSVAFLLTQLKKEALRIEIANSSGASVFVDAELANNAAKQARGLMFRNSLGGNEGMLFMFNNEDYRSFWMMNTTIPLDAIFFSANGSVVDIIQMEPCKSLVSCKTYRSSGKAKYVLEANLGFAQKNGIVPGKSSLAVQKLP
jgi:uncharacterized membrane protein (UPF0127 family)